METYSEGGDAGLGSGRQIVGLRNISKAECTLFGLPRLEFFSKAGNRLAIPYLKNEQVMMVAKQPEELVTLAPGEFAYFMIGTGTGNQSYRFNSMRVVLPGDNTPLGIGWGEAALDSIEVSAIVAGVNSEDNFAVPSRRIAVVGGSSFPGLSITMNIPAQPKGPFDAHLTAINTGIASVRLDEKQCSLMGQLINSAAKTVWETEQCGTWLGEISETGVLRPGARATADIQVGEVPLQLCREGTWNAKFSLNAFTGTVQFAEFPFTVVSTQCSDSEHVGDYVDPNTIHWSIVSQHGVRLGIAVQGATGAAPAMVPFSEKNPRFLLAEFHAGEPIKLLFYLDDLEDAPLVWERGPDAFRVVARASGKDAMLAPTHTMGGAGGDVEEMVLPHSWRYAQTLNLNDLYDLGPGSYDLAVGPRTLMGDAAGANSPASGWPYAEGSAITGLLIRIVP